MKLLLTILSVLAGWTLLGELLVGLLAILKPLERIRGSLQQIAMGVRAIFIEGRSLPDLLRGRMGSLAARGEQHLEDD